MCPGPQPQLRIGRRKFETDTEDTASVRGQHKGRADPVSFLLRRGISFSTGTLKQGQAGRAESEGKETDNDEKEQGIIGQQGQVQGRTAHLKVTGRAEGDEDAENENQDVHRQKIPSRNTRVGKKRGGYEKHADAHGCDPRGQKTSGDFKKYDNFKQGIDKHREKQELQVFPDRFVHRGEQSYKRIFTAPFIAEMQQNTGGQRKQNTGGQIGLFTDSHNAIPPLEDPEIIPVSHTKYYKSMTYTILYVTKVKRMAGKRTEKGNKNACPTKSIFGDFTRHYSEIG